MQKKPLIAVSICAVVLLVFASLTNVVGFQTVQSSNQKMINPEIDQKELLFQTIADVANNKEILKVIIGSEITGKRFFNPDIKFFVFNPPVLTEKFLKRANTMGVILYRTLSKPKTHSVQKQPPVINQGLLKEISAVIERDATLNSEMAQLSSLSCGCENQNTTIRWSGPVYCILLWILFAWVYFVLRFGAANPYYPWNWWGVYNHIFALGQQKCGWSYQPIP